MKWPTLVIDNFFNNFEVVKKLSEEVEYFPPADGNWPGMRSKLLHDINYPFFEMTCSKMIEALYPMNYENIKFTARMTFQKIPFQGTGFIHQDDDEISSIIFISGKNSGGTSLHEPKTYPYDRDGYVPQKWDAYKNPAKIKTKKFKDVVNKHNSQFDLKTKVVFKPNRALLFDCHEYHQADNFGGERVTLITFFQSIKTKDGTTLKSHISECNKRG
tara:strand:+ start:441 stop:1088 length:648 start_codon:yes stop_codon:yes gene_type:complete